MIDYGQLHEAHIQEIEERQDDNFDELLEHVRTVVYPLLEFTIGRIFGIASEHEDNEDFRLITELAVEAESYLNGIRKLLEEA